MMIEESSSGVRLSAQLPLTWRETANILSSYERDKCMHSNVKLMQLLALIEGTPPITELEFEPGVISALERLEGKIDLALELLTRLIAHQFPLPPSVPVVLGAAWIEWDTVFVPAQQQNIEISLYLSPKLTQPLLLPARVAWTREANGGFRVHADFFELTAETQEWLERTLFRYHRRAIQIRPKHE